MQLDQFRQEVNWNLACGPIADADLPVVGVDGDRPVVVALETELLSTLLGRLRAVGGFANLFVRSAKPKRVRMAAVIDQRSAIIEPDEDMTPPADRPGATATVGMFLDYVEQRPRGVALALISGDANRPALARDAHTVDFAGITS
jgi:hypothetical protein